MNAVKGMVRSLFALAFPNQFNAIQAIRARRNFFRLSEQWGDRVLTQRVIDRLGRTTLHGPFQGMRLPDGELWPGASLIVLGSIEEELHTALNEVLSREYHTAVNVGCAEGYYAVGFAYRLKNAKTVAYDIDPAARSHCRLYAKANGVEQRLDVRGTCTHASLSRDLQSGPSLLFCDCEGYEMVLLDPQCCPELAHTDMIVEIHEDEDHRAGDELLKRFSTSHDTTIFWQHPRDAAKFPELVFLTPEERNRTIGEARGTVLQRWAMLLVRRSSSGVGMRT